MQAEASPQAAIPRHRSKPRRRRAPCGAASVASFSLWTLFPVFAKIGAVLFGSGYVLGEAGAPPRPLAWWRRVGWRAGRDHPHAGHDHLRHPRGLTDSCPHHRPVHRHEPRGARLVCGHERLQVRRTHFRHAHQILTQ